MKKMAYRPKKSGISGLEAYFAVMAFAEEGVFVTAEEFLESHEPVCTDGYEYDEELDMCVAKA